MYVNTTDRTKFKVLMEVCNYSPIEKAVVELEENILNSLEKATFKEILPYKPNKLLKKLWKKIQQKKELVQSNIRPANKKPASERRSEK